MLRIRRLRLRTAVAGLFGCIGRVEAAVGAYSSPLRAVGRCLRQAVQTARAAGHWGSTGEESGLEKVAVHKGVSIANYLSTEWSNFSRAAQMNNHI